MARAVRFAGHIFVEILLCLPDRIRVAEIVHGVGYGN
jgi:hypothetical protein